MASASRFGAQRFDAGEQKQPFRIRLGFAHLPGQLRKARSNQGDRAGVLTGTVKRRPQRRQFTFGHILQFVNEQHKRCMTLGCGGYRQVDQINQIDFEVPVVGYLFRPARAKPPVHRSSA